MIMVDLTCQRFFTQPKHPLQRQYEALRSIFVNRRSQKEVAEEFGYQYDLAATVGLRVSTNMSNFG